MRAELSKACRGRGMTGNDMAFVKRLVVFRTFPQSEYESLVKQREGERERRSNVAIARVSLGFVVSFSSCSCCCSFIVFTINLCFSFSFHFYHCHSKAITQQKCLFTLDSRVATLSACRHMRQVCDSIMNC